MRKRFATLTLSLGLVLTACGSDPGVDSVEFADTEDCDREDALAGERECTSRQIKAARDAEAKRKAGTAPAKPKAPATKPKTPTKKK